MDAWQLSTGNISVLAIFNMVENLNMSCSFRLTLLLAQQGVYYTQRKIFRPQVKLDLEVNFYLTKGNR
jgi:hypothetical protein